MEIILLGPQGSGKGTQAARLARQRGLVHLATGEILRAARRAGTELGNLAASYLDAGQLVPDAVMIDLVRQEIRSAPSGVCLDGFPRTLAQAQALDETLAELGRPLDLAVALELPEAMLLERISGRRVCTGCGAVYHIVYAPSRVPCVCDACGGRLEQRSDDQPEAVAQRLRLYREKTAPLLDYYARDRRLREVDARGDVEEVYRRIDALLPVSS